MKKDHVLLALALFISFVFIQSLFFKFADAPETQHIFGTLDAWAGELGFAGLFSKSGPFSQYVIGSAELVASLLLLTGTIAARLRVLQGLGGLMGTAIMTGAISFHLFTPLGVEVQGDGGTLFIMACIVWASGLYIGYSRRTDILALIGKTP